MKILGLTGSIGMGKSTAANQLRAMGIPVFDADQAVNELYQEPAAIAELQALLPEDFQHLPFFRGVMARAVERDAGLLPKLKSILHPKVRQRERDFLDRARAAGESIGVLDIPLLFESGESGRCDAIAVVTAPKIVQYWRVLRRPGMSWAKFKRIIARQMPDAEKRARADFVVETGFGLWHSARQWRRVLRALAISRGI